MAKFSDVLLTVDFDRTLTAPDSTIPQRNLDAIRYFMDNGGAFTVNTGRSIPMYSRVRDLVPVNAPLLLYNGSAAYDSEKEEFLFAHEIDLDMTETLKKVMALFPDNPVELQGMDKHYLFKHQQMWRDFCIHEHCPWAFAKLGDDLGPFLKFTLYGEIRDVTVSHLFEGSAQEIAQIDQVQKKLEELFGDKCAVFRAAPRIIDVHAKGVSKARSARQLQKELGRPILVCVGDGENDINMLQAADYAYCPGDAILRSQFENVCPCAEGAVADVICKKIPEMLNN